MLPAYRCLAKAAFGPQFKWGHHSRDGNENCLTPTTTAWYLAPSFARAWFPPPRSGWKQHGLHQLRFHKTGTHSKEIVQLSVLWWFGWWNFTCHNCFIGPFAEKLLFIIYFTNYLVDGKKNILVIVIHNPRSHSGELRVTGTPSNGSASG